MYTDNDEVLVYVVMERNVYKLKFIEITKNTLLMCNITQLFSF